MANAAQILPIGSAPRRKAYEAINRYVIEHPINAILNYNKTTFVSSSKVLGAKTMAFASRGSSPDLTELSIAKGK
jgi:hypothetical protein